MKRHCDEGDLWKTAFIGTQGSRGEESAIIMDRSVTAGRHGTGAVARVYILFCGQERWRGGGKTSPQWHTCSNKATTSNPSRIVPSTKASIQTFEPMGPILIHTTACSLGKKWRWVSYGCSVCMMLASTDWEKGEPRRSVWGTRCVCSSRYPVFTQQIIERVGSGTKGSRLGLLSVVEFSRMISPGYYCQVCKLPVSKDKPSVHIMESYFRGNQPVSWY